MKNRIFFILLFVTTVLYAAGPFYVDDDSGNDGNDGSFSAPFATIQHAVDIASAGLPTITSSTIYVFPGTYLEDVVIKSNKNSSCFTIMALSNVRPILDGGGLGPLGLKYKDLVILLCYSLEVMSSFEL